MEKNYLTGLFGLILLFFSLNMNAQSLKSMDQQKAVLELQTQLKTKQISLEKEKLKNAQILQRTNNLNNKSNDTDVTLNSATPNSSVDQAKDAVRALKRTESANRDLDKSNKKIQSLENDIQRIQAKLQKMNYTVDITTNN
ncbi:hypothetical protein SAMN05421841_2316 [Chryseobacterium wanjuense]|jgi:hypothetical protein|uniref:Uncharacterized protein n=1 Tax=Chryseobacterium wanjuense TaxID=356305 RepID=A0A1I0QXQ8_9FLAO|nr:hypothetical protein [Chryseobacterium wanjuense]SEW32606.1 hypothetical protein SAMN05421841_2316 [Chryseobacterium wanjuense]